MVDLTTMEYFKMLDESPTQILGKLIFVNNFSPTRFVCTTVGLLFFRISVKRITHGSTFTLRLESVADKLHVKLMQIIVNSCCPTVAVSTTNAITSEGTSAQFQQNRMLLNYSPTKPSCIRHPEVAVRELLTKLVQLMKGRHFHLTFSIFVYIHAFLFPSDMHTPTCMNYTLAHLRRCKN